jgi:hypothetical protein
MRREEIVHRARRPFRVGAVQTDRAIAAQQRRAAIFNAPFGEHSTGLACAT